MLGKEGASLYSEVQDPGVSACPALTPSEFRAGSTHTRLKAGTLKDGTISEVGENGSFESECQVKPTLRLSGAEPADYCANILPFYSP